jgi:hypothetical protein
MVKTLASLENSHAEHWRERLNYWENALAQKPDSPIAWRWRIQVKILRFMLSRYGAAPLEDALPHEDGLAVFHPAPNPKPAREAWQLSRTLWKVHNANLTKPEEFRNPIVNRPTRRKSFFNAEDASYSQHLMIASKMIQFVCLIIVLLPLAVIALWLLEDFYRLAR